MFPDLTPIRHAQLFELLRQKNLSESTSVRLNARRVSRARTDRVNIDQQNAAMLCTLAIESWASPAEPVRG